MAATGLDTGYPHYFDDVPAPMIAVVNLMSMFGLHRRLRAAMVGHFVAAEITTAPSAARMVKAIKRLGGGQDVTRFFAEHVEADAVHEQVLRHEVVVDLLDREPELAADVVFGVRATEFLESLVRRARADRVARGQDLAAASALVHAYPWRWLVSHNG